ncbi:MAG: transferrin receptor-like dimerization domain-containing protein, partial [Isosphaeraceae bacterium]
LVYANWDAEEYGLVGSTEWAEEHEKTVDQKIALLLNVDSAVSGKDLSMSGVPSLRDLALDAAGAVTDVRTGRTLRDIWLAARHSAWAGSSPLGLSDPLWDEAASGSASQPRLRSRRFIPQLRPLGSGSDYTAFLDHLGVPSLDIGFSGNYGVYHSIYDDFTWMEKFGDPEFLTHTMAARLYTAIALRAAAAEVLPLRFTPYGLALRDHVDELRLIQARHIRTKASPAGGSNSKEEAADDTFEGLPSLVAAVRAFQARAEEVDRALDGLTARDAVADGALAKLNDLLVRVERAFLLPAGLPGRPWFRHAIYAPGVTTGYGAWPLPAVREALESPGKEKLGPRVARTVAVLKTATAELGKVLEAARSDAATVGQAR